MTFDRFIDLSLTIIFGFAVLTVFMQFVTATIAVIGLLIQ